MKRSGLMLAAAVIIVSDAFVLIGVARNRAGTPVETIQLTQRELPTGFHEKEDTGISLRFNWNIGFGVANSSSWLDEAKLKSLGFDAGEPRDIQHQPLPRPAFIVLEYNGPAWDDWLRGAQRLPYFKATQTEVQSRLFAIDAGKSAEPLLQKYADRRRYLVVRGVIRAYANHTDPVTHGVGPWRLEGSVSELLPQNIHVDPSLAPAFAKAPYTVTLAYGQRFEPWVLGP